MGSTVFVSVIFFQDPVKCKQINYQIFIAFFPLLVQKSSVAESLLFFASPGPGSLFILVAVPAFAVCKKNTLGLFPDGKSRGPEKGGPAPNINRPRTFFV